MVNKNYKINCLALHMSQKQEKLVQYEQSYYLIFLTYLQGVWGN